MGSLLKLQQQLNKQRRDESNEGRQKLLKQATDKAWDYFLEGVKGQINAASDEAGRKSADMIAGIVQEMGPALHQAISSGISSVLDAVGRIETLDELKGLVKDINIPDHRNDLAGLRQAIRDIKVPETDLAPVLLQLDIIQDALEKDDEVEEEQKEWVFKVNRDPLTKLIESIEAKEA